MTRKQLCVLALMAALVLTALAVWKLSFASSEPIGSTAAVFTSSIVLYLMYLFSTSSGRTKK